MGKGWIVQSRKVFFLVHLMHRYLFNISSRRMFQCLSLILACSMDYKYWSVLLFDISWYHFFTNNNNVTFIRLTVSITESGKYEVLNFVKSIFYWCILIVCFFKVFRFVWCKIRQNDVSSFGSWILVICVVESAYEIHSAYLSCVSCIGWNSPYPLAVRIQFILSWKRLHVMMSIRINT